MTEPVQEAAPVRTKDQVNQDYTNACAQFGDAIFKRDVLSKRIQDLGALVAQFEQEAAALEK